MADRRRAELAEMVADACEAVKDDGFPGLMEQPVLKLFTDLHKLNQTAELSKLLASLEDAATRQISSRTAPGFPDLMVMATLMLDVLGPAGPPEGADSPLDPEFKSLAANLRLALCSALLHFARPGSEEAKQGLPIAAGMLAMLHEKLGSDLTLLLAVEHGLLRLLFRCKGCVVLLRDKAWELSALRKQVEALKEYDPEADEAAEAEEAADGEDDVADEEDGGEEEAIDDDGEGEGDENNVGAEEGADGTDEEAPEEAA